MRIEEPEWSETMPPFLTGGVLVAPDGRTWVTRTGAARDTMVVIDVFDTRGIVERSVLLPAGSRVVGFGPNTVFVARTDPLGLQYLRRYRP